MKKLALVLLIALSGFFTYILPQTYQFEDIDIDLDNDDLYEDDFLFSDEVAKSPELTETEFQAMQAQQKAAQVGIEKSSTLADEVRKATQDKQNGEIPVKNSCEASF